jgi:uncharacterized protein YeaO (DUF488 family)
VTERLAASVVTMITLKRALDSPSADDGYRILVDRLWPRGVARAAAHVDLWLRDIAPSTKLRTWYRHDPERWPAFRERYIEELAAHGELLDLILDIEHHRLRVTLLFNSADRERNQAVVLLDELSARPPHRHH